MMKILYYLTLKNIKNHDWSVSIFLLQNLEHLTNIQKVFKHYDLIIYFLKTWYDEKIRILFGGVLFSK